MMIYDNAYINRYSKVGNFFKWMIPTQELLSNISEYYQKSYLKRKLKS